MNRNSKQKEEKRKKNTNFEVRGKFNLKTNLIYRQREKEKKE